MPLPVVAIVGRPNVGKSSLFNWLVGLRISIVDPTAGVTRDRISSIVEEQGRFFELTDTGGIGIVDSDDLTDDVERQIQAAIDQADVILFVTDARTGPMALDEVVATRLRTLGKPVLLVVNKCDTQNLALEASQFHHFGYQPVIPVSAEQLRGKDELLTEIVKRLPPPEPDEGPPEKVELLLAIVGRRNVGKSTFINSLAQAERVIVSEVPGTTRDSVDVRFTRDGKVFVAIDTAGVRKRASLANDIEYYSLHRAERSIRRADVVLMFFDGMNPVSRVDKQLTEYIVENHKPAIFVVNKWDLLKDQVSTEEFGEYLAKVYPMLDHVPVAFITAKEGKNVFKVLNLAQHLAKQASLRVGTGELNRVLRNALLANPPVQKGTRMPKIYYGAQVASSPPTIVLFTNGPELFDDVYRRYLLNVFRRELPFPEVAIKLDIRHRRDMRKGAAEEPDLLSRPEGEPEKPAIPKPKRTPKGKNRPDSELWDL
ncbi:MAG: ribosome biogenesis GTPase Der [Gemmataceae bacterium]|jgi:GTP-binding protein|nr:ribosome biogenesis GTPase Der [Gemmataceae bacterium]